MSRDRQEQRLKKKRLVESDRDQTVNNKGATVMESPEAARNRNKH